MESRLEKYKNGRVEVKGYVFWPSWVGRWVWSRPLSIPLHCSTDQVSCMSLLIICNFLFHFKWLAAFSLEPSSFSTEPPRCSSQKCCSRASTTMENKLSNVIQHTQILQVIFSLQAWMTNINAVITITELWCLLLQLNTHDCAQDMTWL